MMSNQKKRKDGAIKLPLIGVTVCSALALLIPAAILNFQATAVAAGAVLLSAGAGYFIVRRVLELVFGKQELKQPYPPVLGAPPEPKVGTYTGLVERTAVTLFVITGFTAGIAVVVAIKGLGRFKDLRENEGTLAEQFMLGSMLSLSWAVAVGYLALALYRSF